MAERPSVLLLRAARAPDPYLLALAHAGYDARCAPVLHFEPVGRQRLAEALTRAPDFAGLILTSTRAVDALRGLDVTAWRAKPTFVVGPSTAVEAQRLGLRPVGEATGRAEDLADLIISEGIEDPLLFLCGDRRRDELPDRLSEAGVPVEERVVYHTIPDASALTDVPSSVPDWVVFFSPSGVEAANSVEAFPWNRVRVAAIGPTTADALREAGSAPAAVATTPTPEALVTALSLARSTPDV